MLLFPIGDDEGKRCNREGCDGEMTLVFENCTCFSYAPCSNCMNSLHCPVCGVWSGSDGDSFTRHD